ncbi:MAG: IGHMBP2 family helicase [bacterium]
MDLHTYQEKYQQLVELEQEEEMSRHEEEMKKLSGEERERQGRCLLNMTPAGREKGLRGEERVTFRKADRSRFPDLEISVGDLVQISRSKPLHDENPTGTVWEKTNQSLTVSFQTSLPDWASGTGIRIDKYVNNITFQRMLDALFLLPGLSHRKEHLREVLLGRRTPDEPTDDTEDDFSWNNESLNHSQKSCVRQSVDTNDLFLVHGPPGTGKTVTLTEVIAQGVRRGKKILATAPSNVAVDNLLECLVENGVDAVRVGHPARAHPTLREHTLDYRLQNRESYRKSQQKRQEAFECIEERKDLTAPTGKWRRGLSNEEIHHLAEQQKGSRGIAPWRIREMSRYIELSDRIDDLFEACDRLEDRAIEEELASANVICATNTTAGSDLLAGFEFDWICIDEATQASEPSCLIPITNGSKLIMAGDHRQLPPTVLSEEAKQKGLEETLFERLMESFGDRISSQLTVQYRMHQDIMNFSNHQFYSGTISAHHSVANHTLDDLPSYHPESIESSLRDTLRPRPVFNWLDTQRCEADETRREQSHSLMNPVEARLTKHLCDGLLNAGLSSANLAVISPYKAQVEHLRVAGFQGREKGVVIISLVRSNSTGHIGFLTDERRLNVSLTRARRKLILIGDSDTLTHAQIYDDLYGYVEDTGVINELDPANHGRIISA